MTSRQRVLAALAHREPDRVPVDQGATRSSGIAAIAYNRFKTHLGITGGATFVYDLVQQLARPEPWYAERFGVDAVDLGAAFDPQVAKRPWTLPDGSACVVPDWFRPEHEGPDQVIRDGDGDIVARMAAGFTCMDQAIWPLQHPAGLDDFQPLAEHMRKVVWAALPSPPFDAPATDARLDEIGRVAHAFRAASEQAIVLPVGCNLFEWTQFLFGMENQYVYIAGEKEKFARVLDALTESHLAFLARLLPRIRGAVDVLVVGDDLGMQRGPQLSPTAYRELFLPRHKRIYEFAKRESGARLMLHSCGGIYPLIPALIEAGVEVLNPVQTSARNMEPERLKREFGRELSFWGGGCDTQHVLIQGTPQEVRDDVRRRLDIFASGGGFVWCPVHNVLADVPPANIEALCTALAESR